ncbi:MAG: hypothetical protein OQJ96_01405 [Flavobacteriales bacterium]|nr:hypothetical protein [Flavobacteriales bacterium]MCW8912579.1 hypothetical protein [Flavobacteriales bacterium]MCW8938184.1 hypothetical protein [Flavobacteriales bacterium]MCW8941016.1 hypothetical protein [Flavobacteriales bacterium]MCW8967024.1 hypothetical protein [Flavobacteriales bacterium]
MKKIFLLAFVFILGISTNAQTTFTFKFNTISLIDPVTTEKYGSVKNDVEIEFHSNKSIVIKNYFTHGKASLIVYDVSINDEVKLFFCYDDDGNNVKVFVSDEYLILKSKVTPYSIVYSNE